MLVPYVGEVVNAQAEFLLRDALARRGVLVRRLQAFEAMASVNAVVFDKTGTLTHDQLRLRDVALRPGADRTAALALAAALADGSLHPVSRAVVAAVSGAAGPELRERIEQPGLGVQARLPDGTLVRLGSAMHTGAMPEHDTEGPRAYLADGQGWLATLVFSEGLREDARAAVQALRGQLTATLMGEATELPGFGWLSELLQEKVGRVLLNGYPTGVEVCDAMVHGGPYPATSDARGTSVGSLAIDRFLRPVCFQNYPDELLPPALQNANPLGIWRLVDGEASRSAC